MREGERSRTAEYMALFRALETGRAPERRLFADPLAASFLSRPLADVAKAARLPGLRPHWQAWARSVADAGEPFVFGFDPAELPAYLRDRGWALVDDISTTEALARYGSDPTGVPAFYRIARARR
jgi:O-methyltransferase involved in polyketide biosynthesis